MIHYNSETQTFNLLLATSVYAFQVDENGRLVHLTWDPRPAGAVDTDLIEGSNGYDVSDSVASFERQTRRDELLAFGDVTYHEVSLKASFASLPGLEPAAHEALLSALDEASHGEPCGHTRRPCENQAPSGGGRVNRLVCRLFVLRGLRRCGAIAPRHGCQRAPRPTTTTLSVSSAIPRSNTNDMCLM